MTATTTAVSDATGMESVDSFRLRAREWIPANLRRLADLPADEGAQRNVSSDESAWQRARALQRTLYEGGFAGICYPEGVRRSRPHAPRTSAPSTRRSPATRCRCGSTCRR